MRLNPKAISVASSIRQLSKNERMKKIIIIIATCGALLCLVNAQDNPVAVNIANSIATKMTDSLSLSVEQKMQIFNINISLYRQKKQLRESTSQPDTLELYLQQIEDKRDGLYKTVLPKEKFKLYKQKKPALLNVN
jgi:hypothetical protein